MDKTEEKKSRKETAPKKEENPTKRGQRGLLCENLSFAASESYKLLRTNIEFKLAGKAKCPVIGVTSSIRGEGKTTTSINLAYTIAETGKKTLIIDGDMRLPNVAKSMLIERKPGLSNLLTDVELNGECFKASGVKDNLQVLPAGMIPPNPSELLGSEEMGELLTKLREQYDFIILDLPPVDIVSDALVAARHLDGLVLVVRQGYTARKFLDQCMQQMNPLMDKLLGFVMTDAKKNSKGYYYTSHYRYKRNRRRYGYGSGYGYGSKYAKSYGYGYAYARSYEESSNKTKSIEDEDKK